MIDAAEIAARLADRAEAVCERYLDAGVKKGSYWIVGDIANTPGRSMFVLLSGDKKGRWQDKATGEHGNLLDVLVERKGGFGPAMDEARSILNLPAPAPPPKREMTEAERMASALKLWDAARPVAGSLAELYLRRRLGGRSVPDEVLAGESLRFHPACPFGQKTQHPCLVALFTDAITLKPRAIHRTALTPAGEKIDRKTFGPVGGCVIRLWPDAAVERGLVVGEGIETVLAASFVEHRGTPLRPAWASGFAGSMRSLPVLPGIDALTLLVDHDASEAGQSAAADCASRWSAAGREVIRLTPKRQGDFNDVLQAAA